MYWLRLPSQASIDKFIPKSKFFEKAVVNTKLKDEFTRNIQRITRKYKLSDTTIGIPKTETIEEIQIFEIQLRQKIISKNILKLIDKAIPYPILYVLVYQDDVAYAISYQDTVARNYYISDWNQDISFDFNGINLEKVYQNTITSFITKQDASDQDFETTVTRDAQIKSLIIEIQALQNKVKNQKQFNKKVELNKILLHKQQALQKLSS